MLLCFRQIEAKEAMSSAVLIARDRQTILRVAATWFAWAMLLSFCLAAPSTASPAKSRSVSAEFADPGASAAKARACHHHRRRPRRNRRQLSSPIRHRGHARWSAAPGNAAFGHRRHPRPAQRPGLPPAFRRGQERCLGRRRLRARGLLRRLPDSRFSPRSRHRF